MRNNNTHFASPPPDDFRPLARTFETAPEEQPFFRKLGRFAAVCCSVALLGGAPFGAQAITIPDADGDGIADAYDSAPNDATLPGVGIEAQYRPLTGGTTGSMGDNLGQGETSTPGNPDNDFNVRFGHDDSRHPIEVSIVVDKATPKRSALLSVYITDVDIKFDSNGNPYGEIDDVYLNGHKLGHMVGDDGLKYSTVFSIPDLSWVNLGDNVLEIYVDQIQPDDSTYWLASLIDALLIIDQDGSMGDAVITSLTTDKNSYQGGEKATVTLQADTTRTSQRLGVELTAYDMRGNPFAFDQSQAGADWSITKGGSNTFTWSFTVPSGLNGIFLVRGSIYDDYASGTDKGLYQDGTVTGFTVGTAAPPTVTAITPDETEQGLGTMVTITGTGFIPGNNSTSCEVGGIALTEIDVFSNTTVTGRVSSSLDRGSHDVVCKTSAASPALANAFTVKATNPAAVNVAVDVSTELREGETVSGTYTFEPNDANLPESGSGYRWQRADDDQATNAGDISGATNQDYSLAAADVDKYVRFCILPKDTGSNTGKEACSNWRGIVTAAPIQVPDTDKDGVADNYDNPTCTDTTPLHAWAYDPSVPIDGCSQEYAASNDTTFITPYPDLYQVTADNMDNNETVDVADNDLFGTAVLRNDANHPVEFYFNVDKAVPRRSAMLSVLINDVDYPREVDEVYLNGHKLGKIVGANNLDYSTIFIIPDLSWVNLGINIVEIQVDVAKRGGLGLYMIGAELIIDREYGFPAKYDDATTGHAEILALQPDKPLYAAGDVVTMTLTADTTRATQDLGVELVAYDDSGEPIAFDTSQAGAQWSITQGALNEFLWTFTLPATGNGVFSVTGAIYDDYDTGWYQDHAISSINLTQAVPAITGITPSSTEVGNGPVVSIQGNNFIVDGTTCSVGNQALANLTVRSNTQVTGQISAALSDGVYTVECTTANGSGTLPNGFSVIKVKPAASNVFVNGTVGAGLTVTGVYTFSDPQGKSEGNSTYRWQRANNASGTSGFVANIGTAGTYTLLDTDRYVRFCVTPVNNTSDTGTEVCSNWITMTEPANHATGMNATPNSMSQITVRWTDAVGDLSGYLLMCSTSAVFTDPVDGTAQSDDNNCADGAGVRNVPDGVEKSVWSGLDRNTQYFFKLYPYESGANINYKIDATPASADATTLNVFLEPDNQPTNLAATADAVNPKITTTWTNSVGTNPASGYLVMCSQTGTFTDPVDTVSQANDTDCSDGSGVVNVYGNAGGTYTWPGLKAGTLYTFRIYAYSNSGADIDYKLDTPPEATATTEPLDAPVPGNHVTQFTADAYGSSNMIFNNWRDAAGPNLPSGYLVRCSTTNSFNNPVDGTPYPDKPLDCRPGNVGQINVPYGTTDYVWTGLDPETVYYFKIFPYSSYIPGEPLSTGTKIKYKTTSAPTATATTNVLIADDDDDGVANHVDEWPTDPSLPGKGIEARYRVSADNIGGDPGQNTNDAPPDGDVGVTVCNSDNVNPIEVAIYVDKARPFDNALLSVYVGDIDYPGEVNRVLLNGHDLGTMIGENNLYFSNIFLIPDLSWVNLGKNVVTVHVDENNAGWCAALQDAQLIIDQDDVAPHLGEARITSLTTNAPFYNGGEEVTVTLNATTSNPVGQILGVELIAYDETGTHLAFDPQPLGAAWPVSASGTNAYTWTFTLPVGQSGLFSVSAAIYDDPATGWFEDSATTSFTVDTSAPPFITEIIPAGTELGTAQVVTIKGTGMRPGSTSCMVGGLPLSDIWVFSGTELMGTVNKDLPVGAYDVACSNPIGESNVLSGGFSVAFNIGVSATEVTVTGIPAVDEVLIGEFTYTNLFQMPGSGNKYQWQRSTDWKNPTTGNTTADIAGATATGYTVTTDDNNAYLRFCVTPSDGIRTGNVACSDWNGPVTPPELVPDADKDGIADSVDSAPDDPSLPGVGITARYRSQTDNMDNDETLDTPDGDVGVEVCESDPNAPIELYILVDQARPFKSALLSVFMDPFQYPDVENDVFLNGHSLGSLIGDPAQSLSTSFFVPDLSWVKLGANIVTIYVDRTATGGCVTLREAQLIVDQDGSMGDAAITGLTTDKAIYNPGESVTVTLSADTTRATQRLGVELLAYDGNGDLLTFDNQPAGADWSITQGAANDYTWTFPLPATAVAGAYSVRSAIYDDYAPAPDTYWYEDGLTATFTVGAISAPEVTGISPGLTTLGTPERVTITGNGMLSGETSCSVGGMILTDLQVVNSNTVAGKVSTSLLAGLYDVVCTTTTGGASNTLLDAFEVEGVTIGNAVPVASGVTVTGTPGAGAVMTGVYLFTDGQGDADSGSTYRWLIADDDQATNAMPISGATAMTYTMLPGDVGKYLRFCVTPSDGTNVGDEACSPWTGETVVIGDSDNDGLNDVEEVVRGTDPASPDTDGDSLTDGDEVNMYNSDPTVNDRGSMAFPIAQTTAPVGRVTVNINRLNGSAGPADVQVTVTNAAGRVVQNSTVTFVNGQSAQALTFQATSSGIFRLTLANPSTGVALGTLTTQTVSVQQAAVATGPVQPQCGDEERAVRFLPDDASENAGSTCIRAGVRRNSVMALVAPEVTTTDGMEPLIITSTVDVELDDRGSPGDLLVWVEYRIHNQSFRFALDQDEWTVWDGDWANLPAQQSGKTLSGRHTTDIYTGALPLPGAFALYSGYRLTETGVVVYNRDNPRRFYVADSVSTDAENAYLSYFDLTLENTACAGNNPQSVATGEAVMLKLTIQPHVLARLAVQETDVLMLVIRDRNGVLSYSQDWSTWSDEVDVANLMAQQPGDEPVSLSDAAGITLFDGEFPGAEGDTYIVFTGFGLPDGTIVFNGTQPLTLSTVAACQ